MTDIEVRVENVYIDHVGNGEDEYGEVTTVLEISVPDIPEATASNDEWEDWAEEMIFPFTGIGKESGTSAYFTEVIKAPEEFDHVIGRTFEWGT